MNLRNLHIKTKIILIIFVSFFVFGIVGGGLFFKLYKTQQINMMVSRLEGLSKTFMNTINEIISVGIDLNEMAGMDLKCRQFVEDNKEVGLFNLLFPDQKIMYSFSTEFTEQDPEKVVISRKDFQTKRNIQIVRYFNQKDYYVYSLPIIGNDLFTDEKKMLGILEIGVEVKQISDHVNRMVMVVIPIVIFIFLIGVIIAKFLEIVVSRPIEKITKMITNISEGEVDFSNRLEVKSMDEVGVLSKVFNQFLTSFQETITQANTIAQGDYSIKIQPKSEHDKLAIALVDMITALKEKDEKIQQKTKEITDILKSIAQGIFTVNLDLTVNPEHSSKAEDFFDCTSFEKVSIEHLLHIKPTKMDDFKCWLNIIQKPKQLKRWDRYVVLSPIQELVVNNQIISIEYRPIMEGEKMIKLMVLGKNITKERLTEKMLAKTQQEHELQMQRVLNLIGQEQNMLNLFFTRTKAQIDKYGQNLTINYLQINLEEAYREMHTIKGTAGSFGFHQLAAFASQAENYMTHLNQQEIDLKAADALVPWKQAIQNLYSEFNEILAVRNLLFKEHGDGLYIKRDEYYYLLERIIHHNYGSMEQVFLGIFALDSLPLASYCKKYANIIDLYCSKNDKEVFPLKVVPEELKVHREVISLMDSILVHLVRNAIDHGIEDVRTRRALGKEAGLITISCEFTKKDVVFMLEDDGRGIDAQAVAQSALKKGFITQDIFDQLSDQEKIDLIFLPQFSTRDTISDISGRGVGLDVVKADLKNLGGDIKIKTELNNGTTFKLWIPIEQPLLKLAEKFNIKIGNMPDLINLYRKQITKRHSLRKRKFKVVQ